MIPNLFQALPNLGNPDYDLKPFNAMLDNLDLFEKDLKARGSKFFGGDQPGMLDYMIWPWFERLEVFTLMGGDKLQLPKTRFSKLVIRIFLYFHTMGLI